MCVTKGTISCRCSLLYISVFWLTVIYYKISWVRAVGHSGILVPHSIYIHINISVWDFIYLLIIAVKFCNIYKVLNLKKLTKSSEGPISKFHIFSASFCIVIKLFSCFIVFWNTVLVKLCILTILFLQGFAYT